MAFLCPERNTKYKRVKCNRGVSRVVNRVVRRVINGVVDRGTFRGSGAPVEG
jgi:hypothetical protein